MKNSGYAVSYDYRVQCGDHERAQMHSCGDPDPDSGMNFWATIEHSLQYKYKKNIPDHIRENWKQCGGCYHCSGSGDVPGA